MKRNYRELGIADEYKGQRYYNGVLEVPHYEGKPTKVILDTDIAWLNDDSIAMALCIGSDEVELLGVTVVEGNYDQEQSLVEALSLLEKMGYDEVPIWRGAERPLAHYRGRYEENAWGAYASYPPINYPLGRPPKLKPADGYAVKAISDLARKYPHEVTIFAVGPMTNIALALASDPELAGLLKSIMMMGGSVAGLPNGAGNCVPFTEFNFFVDPEAAAIVLRSGVPLLLVTLNACRGVSYTREFHEAIKQGTGVGVDMLEERMAGVFDVDGPSMEAANFSHYGLFDSTACVLGMHPELGEVQRLAVQIDLSHGPSYGASYAFRFGSLAQAKIDNLPGTYEAMVQPARLDGAVSDPVELDVCVNVPDPDAVREYCRKFLTALRPSERWHNMK